MPTTAHGYSLARRASEGGRRSNQWLTLLEKKFMMITPLTINAMPAIAAASSF
jgi:hypothetical protein